MASPDESSLLSKLESSNSTTIYSLFVDYLRPVADLKTKNQTQIRTLAKKFLTFLNKSLSILQKRLSTCSEAQDPNLTTQLFDTYDFCLNCLDSISSQLSCKPYMIQSQRVRLMSCLEASGKHEETEDEGFRVLERLRSMDFEGKSSDSEFARVFVEIVAVMVKSAAMRRSKDGEVYRRLLGLVEEARPWFSVLDANAYEKLHRLLVCYLGKCTQYVVGELMCFNGDLVREFCVATLTEYAKSSIKDQFCKFSLQLCSSLFLLQENNPSLIIGIILFVLDSIASQCKVDSENSGIDLIELVSYCANKCRAAGTIFCSTVAEHLNKIADDFPQVMPPVDLMMRLYATGLCLISYEVKFADGLTSSKSANNELATRILLDDGDQLHNLTLVLGALRNYFSVCCKEFASSRGEYEGSVSQICLHSDSGYEASTTSIQKNREAYMLPYLNALKFLCQPLVEQVNLEKKELVAEIESASIHPCLCSIQETFDHFSDTFVFFQSFASERERERFDDSKTILCVAVATFILSITTNCKLKKTMSLIKNIIAGEWIQPQGLKYLFASLYNIGVLLYRNKQVKEASKALKLCCRASWACAVLLCKMFVSKADGIHGELSGGAIVDFVNEACTKSAFLLDVLHHCGSQKMEKVIVESLENWAIAANLFRMLPGPKPLVKQWVKIECKLRKNSGPEDNPPTLYDLLSATAKVSEKTIGVILEEELHAYEELNPLVPDLCQRMQMKIINILQQSVYIAKDDCVQSSRILLREGRILRAKGAEGLRACIQCLSKAISIMNGVHADTSEHGTLLCHQLAMTYCLRALCTQEAEPNSKQIIEDIGAALNLWLRMSICSTNDECNMLSENTILLLYNVVDLLSIKGCIEFHHDIYKLMIRLFKWKNVPVEKYLSILWESRRLSHALCVSPVNDAFLMNLAEQCGEHSKSLDFWIRCLKETQPLLVGLQQSFLFSFSNSSCNSYNCARSGQQCITIDDVKKAACELISSVPLLPRSIFFIGYLYYDLCERLIAHGQLFEALSYAKEAHRLRTQLFQEKFSYSIEQQVEKNDEVEDIIQKPTYGPKKLKTGRSVASEVWSFDSSLGWNVDDCYLSPWNVLQCYLESTLQVGIVHELVGNGVEAETFLQWGKNISCSQSLPQFIIAFSSVLGKLYRKKRLWDLAEKEVKRAKQILGERSSNLSCLKCTLILEITVDQQLGDLSRSYSGSAVENISTERLSHAEELYKSALNKLNLSEWKNSVSLPEQASSESTLLKKASLENVEYGATNTFIHSALHQPDTTELTSRNGLHAKVDRKKCRKTKNAPKSALNDQYLVPEPNSRITRSKYQSSQNQCLNDSIEVPSGILKHAKGNNVSDIFDIPSQWESVLESKSCTVDSEYKAACICNKTKCWHCLPGEVIESGLLVNFVNIKWEFVRRRLSLRVLAGIGKCYRNHDDIHYAHKIMLQSVSVLLSRDLFCHTYSSLPQTFLLDLIGKEFSGDVFAVERAAVLYNICWFSLKCYQSKKIRESCCDLSHIEFQKLVSWLKLAFVLSREVPILFQKVSRLLAVMYILSSTSKHFSLSSSCKKLSESHWASFFHQASLGTHLNYQFLSNMSWRCKAQDLLDPEGLHVPSTSYTRAETYNSLRISPEYSKDLEQFVKDFFVGLPSTTIICVTLLGDAYATFLQELLPFPSCVHAWMLSSRLNSKIQPIVVLLPINPVLEESAKNDDDTSTSFGDLYWEKSRDRHWHCPWGSTIVDDIAPAFKLILEDSYLSSSAFPLEDNEKTRSLWWMQRKKLDHRLGELLRKLEDSWLGPWKHMLLGEWSNCKNLDEVHKKLVRDLKSKCKVDVNESLLRVVLGGFKDGFKEEECIAQLCSKKSCYIGAVGYYDNDRFWTSSRASNGVEKFSELALHLIHEAVNELEEEHINREPIILVLDGEVQMLPWENMPVLRKQEVYRMPSVGSISAILERIHHHQEHAKGLVATFPSIDPLDAFYLLNPSGDLFRTQFEFEEWCKNQNLEGKAGSAPTTEELVVALKNHDLFLYFGHGSGSQYISRHDLLKLEKCAATFLMGCSSGSLSLNGCYIPQGTPLYYLLAGSPVIFANLWDVTDKDIDRFGKAMLDAWLRERSSVSLDCNQCISVEENEAKNGRGKGNNKKVSRKKLPETNAAGLNKNGCHHRPKLGSFMGQAREACKLPFLIGASPVCYGVPTGIRRKTSL